MIKNVRSRLEGGKQTLTISPLPTPKTNFENDFKIDLLQDLLNAELDLKVQASNQNQEEHKMFSLLLKHQLHCHNKSMDARTMIKELPQTTERKVRGLRPNQAYKNTYRISQA